MFLLVPLAAATTWVVNKDGTGDFGQVQSAIDVARAGDIIEVGPGTYRGALVVRSRILTLRSRDGSGTTILDGAGEAELLRLESADVLLEGFTLVNDGGAGMVTVDRSEVEARDLVFSGLLGAFSMENGAASFEDCAFVGGVAEMGAGIRADAGTVNVVASSFEGNAANYGADVYLGPGARLVLDSVASSGAVATEAGGSVYMSMLADAVVSECSFEGSSAVHGGAIALDGANLTVEGTSFVGSDAERGGAVYAARGTVASLGSSFEANMATRGGAVAIFSGGLDDVSSRFVANAASDQGGAVYLSSSRLGMAGSRLEANVAPYTPALRMLDGEAGTLSGVVLVGNVGSQPVWGDAWPWTVEGLSSEGHHTDAVAWFAGSGELSGVSTSDGGLVFDGDFVVHDSTVTGAVYGVYVYQGAVSLLRSQVSADNTALGSYDGDLRTSAVTVARGGVTAAGGAIVLAHTTVLHGTILGLGGVVEGHSVIATGPIEGDVTLAYSDATISPWPGNGNITPTRSSSSRTPTCACGAPAPASTPATPRPPTPTAAGRTWGPGADQTSW
ncbi:MAG: hypothetical protein FJ102_11475 [Deltaproteobacteria bacterium]|nr:hypothetical protein [Deltaproteobacteria bacterium]